MLVVLALLAAPAMATNVDVGLTIVAYARVQGLPSSITITLTNGAVTNLGHIQGEVVSNVVATVGATIVPESGAVGAWSIEDIVMTAGDTPGAKPVDVLVRVANVPIDAAPQTDIKQAVVTITVSTTP